MQTWHPNGMRRAVEYRQRGGALHREDGPALLRWSDNGVLVDEEWWRNGRLHKIDGPALQKWDAFGQLIREEWYRYGSTHRDGGPAIRKYIGGRLIGEQWLRDSYWHRDNGPAYLKWDNAGVLIQELWWQEGCVLTDAEIEKIMRPGVFKVAIHTLPQPIAEEIWDVFRAV
jgi:hypothetical protein